MTAGPQMRPLEEKRFGLSLPRRRLLATAPTDVAPEAGNGHLDAGVHFSQSQIDLKLCPSSSAALISGPSAQIWPALVSGFFARLSARRLGLLGSSFGQQGPPYTKGMGEQCRDDVAEENLAGGDDWRRIATERDRWRQS